MSIRCFVGEGMRACVCVCVCVCVCIGGYTIGACACARVGLLIRYAKPKNHIFCVLYGSTTFFDIIS